MTTKGKRMAKANPIKSRATNKAVTTMKKFNTLMDAYYDTRKQPRTNKGVNALLNQLTPYGDTKRAYKLGADSSEIKRRSEGKGKRIKRK